MNLPAFIVRNPTRSGTAALATRGSCRLDGDSAASAEGLLTGRTEARLGDIATEGIRSTTETKLRAAKVQRTLLLAVLAVDTARRLGVAVGDAVNLAMFIEEATMTYG